VDLALLDGGSVLVAFEIVALYPGGDEGNIKYKI
jgi:hypothetical protein